MQDAKKSVTWGDIVYDLFLWIFTIVIDLFFREIHPRSTWRIPKTSPIIFVAAPHANQFVDPLLLMRTVRQDAKRRISFLIAEKSLKRKFVGFAARLVGSAGVGRALDLKKPAKGKIWLPDPDNDPLLVKGTGTEFTNEKVYMKGGTLVLPSVNNTAANAEIAEVVSDTDIRLKKPFKGEVALRQLTGHDIGQGNGHLPSDAKPEATGTEFRGTSFQIAPHVDQSHVYKDVNKKLQSGGCIGIFPEGGSHDRTELLPLKPGLAIMALEALQDDPNCGVTIVPVGMNYFHPHKFRSRAVIEFGAPIDPLEIDSEIVEMYRSGDKRNATAKVLDTVYDRLAAVTTLAPDYDTLMMIQAVRRLYNPKGKHLPLPVVVELNRRLIKGYKTYKDDPRIVSLRKQVLKYNATLFRIGLRDHQVSYAKFRWYKVVATLIYRVAKLAVLSIAVVPGVVLFAPVFIAGKVISKIKAKEALAASTVKVRARDVIATWKILVSLALTPVLDVFYTSVAVAWTYQNRVHGLVPSWIPLWLVAAGSSFFFPLVCFAALRFGEIGMDIFKSLKPLWMCINPTTSNTIVRLRETREELTWRISDIINELGPELFSDFDKRRIIPEGELPSPTEERRPSTPRRVQSASGGDEVFSNLTPATPPSGAGLQRRRTDLPHNDSFHDLNRVGIFASRPGTPDRSRSRTNSHDGSQLAKFGLGFSPLQETTQRPAPASGADMDEISKTLHAQMRERGRRRKSQGGENVEMDASWEMADGSSEMSTEIMTPASEMEGEEDKKDQ